MSLSEIQPLRGLEIHVLLDDRSDSFSQCAHGIKTNECDYQIGIRGQRTLRGADLCRACLGLSLLLGLDEGSRTRTLLFDTGSDEGLALENARRLGIDTATIEGIIVSHGHYDHIGGTYGFLEAARGAAAVFAHPQVFTRRAFRVGSGEIVEAEFALDAHRIETLTRGQLRTNRQPAMVLGSLGLLTGETPRRTEYETGLPGALSYQNGGWIPTPDVEEEQALILHLKGRGLVVITGCGHSGVVNTLRYAQALVPEPIYAVIGGFHLATPGSARRIALTAEDLQSLDPRFLLTGHCTGFPAERALTETFGNRHIPYGVGAYLRL